jgi:hypothetical protein
MLRRSLLPLLLALAFAPSALASGGNYVFESGTHAQQAEVHAALDASSFNWSLVPGPVAIHIGRNVSSHASPGAIWLDAGLLDSGRFAWGTVQHEYAHEVDFALLTDPMRTDLHTLLGGTSWWGGGGEGHAQLDCERFADALSWAYWPSPDNVMKPQGAADEGGQVAPAAFRAALSGLLGQAPARMTASIKVKRHPRKG